MIAELGPVCSGVEPELWLWLPGMVLIKTKILPVGMQKNA